MGLKSRIPVLDSELEDAMTALTGDLKRRLKEHGQDSFIGPHEILGVLREEYREYEDEVHANSTDRQCAELLDMAVTCIFGIASLKARQRILRSSS